MKKIGLGILIAVVALALSGVATAIPNQAADVAKEKAKAPDLEKIEFIHWKKGFAKPVCGDGTIHPSEKCGEFGLPECQAGEVCINCKCVAEEEEGPTPTTTCYAFLGQYGPRLLEWKDKDLPVSYVINPTNPDELPVDLIASAISSGAEEWDYWTGVELFNDIYDFGDTQARVQDYTNTLAWGDYPEAGVIAVATVWYNPATKTIVEFDVMFDTDYTWGDVTVNSAVMDLQSIATHELGHGAGLGDVYEVECSAVTMYGYSDYGEIQKRDLETPDITGIQTLYK